MQYDDRTLHRKMTEMGQEPSFPVPPKRKRRDNEESRNQISLIKWWSAAHRGFGLPERALFSVPNGGWRNKVGAITLKREGQRNGVSDLFLMTARGGWHGLFVEMKAKAGDTSAAQEEFLAEARGQNYCTTVCHSWNDAVASIERYLKL